MTTSGDERYLTTPEVARLLGVKPTTVYAYVSRGLLTPLQGKRRSLFKEGDVANLAARGRESSRPANPLEHVATSLSLLVDDKLYYRGRRLDDLTEHYTVEYIAELLWSGELSKPGGYVAPPELMESVRAAVAVLPESVRLTDQLRVAVAVAGAADPLRFDLQPEAVIRVGRTLLGVLVDSIAPSVQPGSLANRLWPALTSKPQPPGLLDAMLISLADHDLAVSTVAARVAASARAHPYAVVSAGLGALDGHYHGTMSTQAYRFLAEAMPDPLGALSERLRAGSGVPGFGHQVYKNHDPRAVLLLDRLRDMKPDSSALAAVDAIGDRHTFPNVDLAIAVVMHEYGMRPDAGEAIFAIARTVGWIAHAMEEYREPGLRFRPEGMYIGQRPKNV
ncbi:MAG TPA: citrate synthase [Pseudonocardiaceae bacterium]